jgi:hypothetical protein
MQDNLHCVGLKPKTFYTKNRHFRFRLPTVKLQEHDHERIGLFVDIDNINSKKKCMGLNVVVILGPHFIH